MTQVRRGEILVGQPASSIRFRAWFPAPRADHQAESFNQGSIRTVLAAVLTGNLALAAAPGNVLLPAGTSGLPKDSVLNVSQVLTLDRTRLAARVSRLPAPWMATVDDGLRLGMDL